MTLYQLELEPQDVSAAELGFRVDTEPAPEPLVSVLLEHPQHPFSLRLSILGASHATTLVVDGLDTVTEEVSCRASGSREGLPAVSESRLGWWGTHHLRGSVDTMSSVAFATLVAQLTSLADSDPDVIAGRFPGVDGALTVVAATSDPAGWRWRTWHLYPTVDAGSTGIGGEVVTTVSSLEVSLNNALSEVVA